MPLSGPGIPTDDDVRTPRWLSRAESRGVALEKIIARMTVRTRYRRKCERLMVLLGCLETICTGCWERD